MNRQRKPKKLLRKYLQLTGIAFQMGIIFYAAAYFGKKLDAYYRFDRSYITLAFILLGMILSLYLITKQLKQINKK